MDYIFYFKMRVFSLTFIGWRRDLFLKRKLGKGLIRANPQNRVIFDVLCRHPTARAVNVNHNVQCQAVQTQAFSTLLGFSVQMTPKAILAGLHGFGILMMLINITF